jgi:N-acetylneuraminic acid mutarotase
VGGNLWLFGGEGFGASGAQGGDLNDLWKFNGSQWTWVSGSDAGGQAGTYGTLGTRGAGNVPGGRIDAVSWVGTDGNLWLFGGIGLGSTGTSGDLNDLWEYTPEKMIEGNRSYAWCTVQRLPHWQDVVREVRP